MLGFLQVQKYFDITMFILKSYDFCTTTFLCLSSYKKITGILLILKLQGLLMTKGKCTVAI